MWNTNRWAELNAGLFRNAPFRRPLCRRSAGIRNRGQIFQKPLTFLRGQFAQDFLLHGHSQLPRCQVGALAVGPQPKTIGPAILFVRLSLDQPCSFHSLQQGCDRIGVAAHKLRQFALSDTLVFQQSPHNRKLIGRHTQMRDAPSKGLVQPVPRPSKQQWQASPFRRIDWQT